MVDLIIKGKHSLNKNILFTIKDVYEDKKNIKILSLLTTESDNVVGIFINNLDEVLSIVEPPQLDIKTEIENDFHISLIELGKVLQLIFYDGSIQMANVLLEGSEIEINNDQQYYDIIEVVKDNLPLLLNSFQICNTIENITDDNIDYVIDLLKEFNKAYPIDIDEYNISKDDSVSVIKNKLNVIRQWLLEQDFEKISNENIRKINKLFVELQKNT